LHELITFLSVLHHQCFASSTGAVLGAVLDPLQHCLRQPEQYLVTPIKMSYFKVAQFFKVAQIDFAA